MGLKSDSILFPQMPMVLLISLGAVMGALCCIATMMFQIYVPATTGYFNLGEIAIYITAILFGPIIGFSAAGIGSMLADIFLGYPHYALATFFIKGLEGFVVGYLGNRLRQNFSPKQLRYLGVCIGSVLALSLGIIGWFLLSGLVEASGGSALQIWWFATLYVPPLLWFIMGAYIGIVTIVLTLRYDPESAWSATAMLLGGCLMITGYFLFQRFVLGMAAIIEVPVNLVQVIAGIMVALPVNERVRKAFVGLGWIN